MQITANGATLALYIAAFICFLLAGVAANIQHVSLRDLGFMFLTLSLFVK